MTDHLSRRSVLRLGLGGAAATLLAGKLTACGNDDGTAATTTVAAAGDGATTTAAAPDPLSVHTSRSASGLGAGMAFGMQEYGEVENLSIEMDVMSPTDAETALLNGQLDMVLFGFLSLVRAHQAGHDNIVMFAPSFASHSSIFTTPDNDATSLADLRGARLGVLARVSAQYNDLLQIAAEQDIDLEADFDLTLADAQLQQGLFLQGELDAICPFEPIATSLILSEDAREVFQFSQEWERMFGTPMASIGWVADKDWLAETGGADQIRGANATSIRAMLAGSEEFEKHAEVYGLEPGDEIDRLAERVSRILTPEWTDDIVENLQFRLDRGVEQGVVEQAFDIEQLIDT